MDLRERKATRWEYGYPGFGCEEHERWLVTNDEESWLSGLAFSKRVVQAERLLLSGRIVGFYRGWAGDFYHVKNVIFGIHIDEGKV